MNKNLPRALVISSGAATAFSAFISFVAGIGLFLRRAATPTNGAERP